MGDEIDKPKEVSLLKTKKEYLTLTELPQFFGTTRQTISRWRKNKKRLFPKPYAKVGDRELFSTDSLIEYAKNRSEE